jgi:ankyrin repeat protein
MSAQNKPVFRHLPPTRKEHLFEAVYFGDAGRVNECLDAGLLIDSSDEVGLSPLHVAVGLNNLELVQLLLDRGARCRKDFLDRRPSNIAVTCGASPEICDLVCDAEDFEAEV